MSRWRARTRITASTRDGGGYSADRSVTVEAHTEAEARAKVTREHRSSAVDAIVVGESMTILEIRRLP